MKEHISEIKEYFSGAGRVGLAECKGTKKTEKMSTPNRKFYVSQHSEYV